MNGSRNTWVSLEIPNSHLNHPEAGNSLKQHENTAHTNALIEATSTKISVANFHTICKHYRNTWPSYV